MARDNFSKSDIDKLKARVAHRCSNPKCRVPTSAPAGEDKVNNIGVAAHISAASPGGARYDKSMSSNERKSIKNGIWLCSNCSIEIDRDEKRYSVSLLEQWKQDAENTAKSELGKKLPSNGETIETVTQALTGLPTKNFLSTAIANVHQATNKSLELIDPRLLIKSVYDGKNISFEIHAKEEVPLLIRIKNIRIAKKYRKKRRNLIEHGKGMEIKIEDISIEGSKLFDEIFNTIDGVLRFLPDKLKATQKLWLVQKETGQLEQFDDIHGTISSGTKSFTFNGSACNGLFNFSYQKSLDGINNNASFSISLDWDKWEGLSLNLLPYFDKILSFFSKIVEGWEISSSLEVNGIEIFSSKGINTNKWDYSIKMNNFLHYTNCCKTISNTVRLNVPYTWDVICTTEEHEHISDVAEIIKRQKIYSENDITRNATCELIVDEECKNVRGLVQTSEPISVCFVGLEQETINIFGTTINLPPRIMSLDSVLPKIHGEIESLQNGDVVKVEWLPQKDFKFTTRYDI